MLFEQSRHPVWGVPLDLLATSELYACDSPPGPALPSEPGASTQLDGRFFSLSRGGPPEVRTWPVAPDDLPELGTVATIEMSACDAWFEEGSEVFYRPRDPYRRVDVLRSGRRVIVKVGTSVVADTTRPQLALETGLPPQWYCPPTDVDWHLLSASVQRTRCQYKGEAWYWDVVAGGETHPTLAWSYKFPIGAVAELAGMVGFPSYDSLVTTLVDGIGQPRVPPSAGWMNPSLNLG